MNKFSEYSNLSKAVKRSWRVIAIIISLVLVLLTAIMTLYLATGVNRQVTDITKNYELRQQVDAIAQLAFNIETSRRGYLLTLENSYLDLYRKSILSVDETLQTLETMTAGNALQTARVSEIRTLVEREQDEVRQTIDLAKAGNVSAAVGIVRGDEGKLLMDQLTKTVTLFINEEDVQLAERNKNINNTRAWLTVMSLLALASAASLCGLLLSRFQRYVRELSEGQTMLRSENVILEQRVLERTAEVEHEREIAERERKRVEVLLQDSNHRIGNSLATVSSLLGLQLRQVDSEDARRALNAARDRVQTISSAHRRLRLGEDMETARVDEFLQAVMSDIRDASNHIDQIDFNTDFAPISLPARDVTTIGIILGELVTNALKHAFTGRDHGEVMIRFQPDTTGVLVLSVEDDGIGWNGEKPERGGLGMLVIEQLCLQFGEEPHYSCGGSGGTRVEVRFASLEPKCCGFDRT